MGLLNFGVIDGDDVFAFYKAYYGSFPEINSYMNPIVDSWTDFASRVSFDKDLQPYVGASLGYNPKTPKDRVYMPESPVLTKARTAIAEHLKDNPFLPNGGRFFLAVDGVYKKLGPKAPVKIAAWELKISNEIRQKLNAYISQLQTLDRLKKENTLLKSLRKSSS